MIAHFHVIETYIKEHGQETGLVSWQMALQSLTLLDEDYQVTLRLLEERQRLLDKIPKCPVHGKCVPYAIGWVEQIKHIIVPP